MPGESKFPLSRAAAPDGSGCEWLQLRPEEEPQFVGTSRLLANGRLVELKEFQSPRGTHCPRTRQCRAPSRADEGSAWTAAPFERSRPEESDSSDDELCRGPPPAADGAPHAPRLPRFGRWHVLAHGRTPRHLVLAQPEESSGEP